MGKYNYGPGFGYIEEQALYSMVRSLKPRKIVEVGSGNSTRTIVAAVEQNKKQNDSETEIICVEPYPYDELKKLPGISILDKRVEEAPLQIFKDLCDGDLLFIDSSHAVKPCADVVFLYLEILPRLATGVTVHIHDIYLPYDYQRNLLKTMLQSSETALLHAFLINNSHVEIFFCMSHLHYDRSEVLKQVFPEYNPQKDVNGLVEDLLIPIKEHFPSSIYLKIK